MKSFNEWYTKINEEIAEPVAAADSTEVTAEPKASSANTDRDSMITDIDAIMTSLETLAGELSESLNEEVNEADTEIGAAIGGATAAGAAVAAGAGLAAAWAIKKLKAMKAKKGQKKVNAMLMKIELAKLKAKEVEDANAKQAIQAKIDTMKKQADELQSAYDEKYKDSEFAAKEMLSVKLQGQIDRAEFLAKETGSDEYKKDVAKLTKKYQDTVNDIERLKKEAEEAAEKEEGEKPAEKPAETETDSEEPAETEADSEESSEEPVDKNSKEGKLDRLNTLLKKAEESGAEEKIKKIKDLIDRVSAKESWQLDGTQLGMLIESEIVKLEAEQILNESNSLSIKERFSKLI